MSMGETSEWLTPVSRDWTASSRRETLHSSVAQAAPIEAEYSLCWVNWRLNEFTRHASSNRAYTTTDRPTVWQTDR